jgi:hypothetical protein
MTTYLYAQTGSNQRGKDVAIQVWKMHNGTNPRRVGIRHYNAGAWAGPQVSAARIVAEEEGYQLIDRGYGGISNKNVNLEKLIFNREADINR